MLVSLPHLLPTRIWCALEQVSVEQLLKQDKSQVGPGKAIPTSGSEEERVVIAFIFSGRERDNLDKVIRFEFHVQERLRFHSLKGNEKHT